MRDIRADLRERLSAAEAERAQLTLKLKGVDSRVDALMRLLEIEDHAIAGNGSGAERPLKPLPDFILALAQHRPVTKADIRTAANAEGYEIDGRHVHAHLNNLLRSGVLRKGSDMRYRTEKNSAGVAH
jgi:hypothetical protein